MKSKEKKSVNKMEDSPPYVWTQEKSIILHLINKKKASNPSGEAVKNLVSLESESF